MDAGQIVTILYTETKMAELTGEVVEDNAEGITIRHTYRKGKRLEFIPREKLESVFIDEEKPARKPRDLRPMEKVTVVEPKKKPEVAEDDEGAEGIYSDDDDFDDSGDDFDDEFDD
jgi:hypothetical protein